MKHRLTVIIDHRNEDGEGIGPNNRIKDSKMYLLDSDQLPEKYEEIRIFYGSARAVVKLDGNDITAEVFRKE